MTYGTSDKTQVRTLYIIYKNIYNVIYSKAVYQSMSLHPLCVGMRTFAAVQQTSTCNSLCVVPRYISTVIIAFIGAASRAPWE